MTSDSTGDPPSFEMSEIKESGLISKFGGLLQYTLKAEDTWGSPVKIWRAVLKMESAVKYCFVPPTKISRSPMMLRVSRENLGSPMRRSLILIQ